MAKMKGKGVVVAGLLAGAASFLSKKENRDKLTEMLNGAKDKASNFVGEQKANLQDATQNTENPVESAVNSLHGAAHAAADNVEETIDENKMMSEGGSQQLLNEFDENK